MGRQFLLDIWLGMNQSERFSFQKILASTKVEISMNELSQFCKQTQNQVNELCSMYLSFVKKTKLSQTYALIFANKLKVRVVVKLKVYRYFDLLIHSLNCLTW